MPDPEPPADPYGYVDPAWGPPGKQPPRWLPLLVTVMVSVLVAGGLFAAGRVVGRTPATAAATYVPGDGDVSYRQSATVAGDQTTISTLVQESATMSGAVGISGLDWNLGVAVLGVVGSDHLDRTRFWRTTTTQIGNLGASQQLIRVYRADAAVELVAESGPGGADVYEPALVELPATAEAGDSWHGEGRIGARRYRSEFRATAAESGCLRVRGAIVESTTAGQPGPTRTVDTTWCRSRGAVVEQVTRDNITTRVESVPRPAPDPTLRTEDETWTWGDPATWRRRDFDLMSTDISLGSGAMAGSPAQVPPVVAASGLVIRPTSGDDLVATTPKTADRWTSLWRMRPGGTLLSLAAFGDVVVVTTSLREVVAYSDAGVRLWSLSLDDVAFWAPSRVDARRIAIADASGAVRVVDVLTGRQHWKQDVDAQVSGPLIADPRAVVVLDAGGDATAFAAGTGQRLWSKALSSTKGALLGDAVVIRTAATLEALDLLTGRHRWLLPSTGTLDALVPFGEAVVAATQLDTQVIAADGTVLRRLPAYEWVSVVGNVMVGWGRTQAEVRDDGYALLAALDTPDHTLGSAVVPPLSYRQGVVVFGRGWTFTTWSDEP